MHKGAAALLWGEPPGFGGVGGTRPPRLSPLGETGKGDQKDFLLAAAGFFRLLCAPFAFPFRNRRLALLPFALFVEPLLRCQLVSSIFKRVLTISGIELSLS